MISSKPFKIKVLLISNKYLLTIQLAIEFLTLFYHRIKRARARCSVRTNLSTSFLREPHLACACEMLTVMLACALTRSLTASSVRVRDVQFADLASMLDEKTL